jgi:hypothetical protein
MKRMRFRASLADYRRRRDARSTDRRTSGFHAVERAI